MPSASVFSRYSRIRLSPDMFSGRREGNTLIWEINLKEELINSEFWGHDQVNFQNEGEKQGDAYDQPGSHQSVRHGEAGK